MPEPDSLTLLAQTRRASATLFGRVSRSFRTPWKENPGTGVRLVLGKWNCAAARHLLAIHVLAGKGDLSMTANVHYRQMFEIMLQVRCFLAETPDRREKLAEKISAWGCIELLDKLEPMKDRDEYRRGYQEASEQLSKYDPALVSTIQHERNHKHNKQRYWFGGSYSELASRVSRGGEDLRFAYSMISGHIHGIWDVTWGAISPNPGELDFRGYPDEDTLHRWAAEDIKKAIGLYVAMWNDIASAVGAPIVEVGISNNSGCLPAE